MTTYKNNQNGTGLCITPLLDGVEDDIVACLDIIENAEPLGVTEEELYQTTVYLSNLLATKTHVIALDNASEGGMEVFRKYLKYLPERKEATA